jgi:flavin-dependent dehydrogenase
MVLNDLIAEETLMNCEVMIAGAGPAGISTWLHLHKYAPQLAEHSIVIEKAVFPRDKLCGGAAGAWSSEVLKHLEVELDISSFFVSDVEFKFGKEIHHFHQPDCFRIVQRIDFDYALVKAAINRGLELKEGERLIDIRRGQDRLIARTNKRTYRVQTLVGADGALSIVRRMMMPPHKQKLGPTIQIYAPVDPRYDSEFNEKKMLINLTPIREGLQGYVWHFPCVRDGAPSMVHGIGDSRLYPDKPRVNLKKILSRELLARNIHPEYTSWSSQPIRWLSERDIISQPHVLLVGDAAGIEPAFGGGIHIALSYGEVAANALIDAFQSKDFSFTDYRKRLQSHPLGKWIQDCTRLALKMYGGRINPLDVAREMFPQRNESPDLISSMIAEVAKVLHNS